MSTKFDATLILHNRLLLELSGFISGSENWAYEDVTQKIISIALEGLEIPRASIWRLNDTADLMECVALSADGIFANTQTINLKASDYPCYFNALAQERFIVADDAHTHPDTSEFSEGYLTPLNIFSMLDAPIRKNGKIVGILCCEQTLHPRSWTLLEQSFAAVLADAAGRALAEKEAKTALEALAHAAHTDPLTGLFNRTKLMDDLAITLSPCLALFDIDGFTDINDFYGYEVGNFILKELGKNLMLLAEKNHNVYRYGNDKFTILCEEENHKKFTRLVESILDHTDIYSYAINDFIIPLKLSAVVSFEPQTHIIHSVDILLKELKKQNRHMMVYDKSLGLEEQISNNIKWNKKIKDALIDDRIVNYFQPILNNHTMKIEKYESLVRLIEEDGAVVAPYAFLEISKRSKQYLSITKKVIENTFEAFANREEQFSINLTMEDILHPDITQLLIHKMSDKRYHSRVVYEIVESESLEKADLVFEFIKNMKKFGCEIAIDDFGTGYSNFEYLVKLTPDYIKIDGSMIKDITSNPDDEEVVKTIIDFAKKRHLKTIAEFVSSREIFEKVLELGIDYSQGYYIGKPQPTLCTKFIVD
jgi:diguanylate cyclase (GGDEF)-like protein